MLTWVSMMRDPPAPTMECAMRLRPALVCAALLAACGPVPSPSPSTPKPSPATPSATPSPGPENQNVEITGTGMGTFDLVAVPVAILHNDATRSSATGVVAHFQTKNGGGRNLGALDSVAVILQPGQTLGVTADCTDSCTGAAAVTVTVTVGGWVPATGAAITAGAAQYACGNCGGGHGYGTVTGTLTGTSEVKGGALTVFAVCKNAAGAVIGGGSTPAMWGSGSTSETSVSVIVSVPPAGCDLDASPGS